jgi:hypothetical protein
MGGITEPTSLAALLFECHGQVARTPGRIRFGWRRATASAKTRASSRSYVRPNRAISDPRIV